MTKKKKVNIGFQLIHGSVVILRQKTTYKQVEAYFRNGEVYAKNGSGFIKMKVTGGTTNPDIVWEEVDGIGDYSTPDRKKFGYVEYKDEA